MSLSVKALARIRRVIEPKLEKEGKKLAEINMQLTRIKGQKKELKLTMRSASSNTIERGLSSALVSAKSDSGLSAWRLLQEIEQELSNIRNEQKAQQYIVRTLIAKKKAFETLEARRADEARKVIENKEVREEASALHQ